jgi:hypothetical protein
MSARVVMWFLTENFLCLRTWFDKNFKIATFDKIHAVCTITGLVEHILTALKLLQCQVVLNIPFELVGFKLVKNGKMLQELYQLLHFGLLKLFEHRVVVSFSDRNKSARSSAHYSSCPFFSVHNGKLSKLTSWGDSTDGFKHPQGKLLVLPVVCDLVPDSLGNVCVSLTASINQSSLQFFHFPYIQALDFSFELCEEQFRDVFTVTSFLPVDFGVKIEAKSEELIRIHLKLLRGWHFHFSKSRIHDIECVTGISVFDDSLSYIAFLPAKVLAQIT